MKPQVVEEAHGFLMIVGESRVRIDIGESVSQKEYHALEFTEIYSQPI